jgi:predicted type IV restriction endonuclease
VPGQINEETTRKTLIDRALQDAGWDIVDYSAGKKYDTVAVGEYPTSDGPADYLFTCLSQEVYAFVYIQRKKVCLLAQ